MLAARLEGWSLIPKINLVKAENSFGSYPLSSTWMPWPMHMSVCKVYSKANKQRNSNSSLANKFTGTSFDTCKTISCKKNWYFTSIVEECQFPHSPVKDLPVS